MKRKHVSILLIIIMVACFAVAASYPVKYLFQKESNETDMDDLRAMRRSALEQSSDRQQAVVTEAPGNLPADETDVSPTDGSVSTEAAVGGSVSTENSEADPVPGEEEQEIGMSDEEREHSAELTDETESTAGDDILNGDPGKNGEQGATADTEDVKASSAEGEAADDEDFDRYYRESDALPYISKEHVQLDTDLILPQYKEIYEQNNDMVGWIYIPGSQVDYPVLQSEERDYYLKRDFYGKDNANGQIILDSACDPWTPSYNLVLSGHNMKSGKMFGSIANYASKSYWKNHKVIYYDSLMEEGAYLVFGAFYSADYDEDEEGFRYNANIQYRKDAELWLEEVIANREYDTGVEAEFGDEFITLTTCTYQRKNGRFVVVARRVREGEVIEE